MHTGLRILKEWCDKWLVKTNAKKYGTLHMRKKGAKKTKKIEEETIGRLQVTI